MVQFQIPFFTLLLFPIYISWADLGYLIRRMRPLSRDGSIEKMGLLQNEIGLQYGFCRAA